MKRATHSILLAALTVAFDACAGEIGHFNGGVMNLRDYVMPDSGVYGVLYNYLYTSNQLNNPQGNVIDSVTVKAPGKPAIAAQVNVNLNLYALAPTLAWVTDIESCGIKYGALVTPTFVDANLNASMSAALAVGGEINGGSFGVGDVYVQPVWLGKSLKHWDFAMSYGFYAPTGKYDTGYASVPGLGPVKTEASANLGYGFWTHQFQGSAAWYPIDNKGTAVIAALTYETNGKKQDFNLTPGDNLSFTWGASQYLPIKQDNSLLLEVGLTGYDVWQISNDSGSPLNSGRDQVHAIGGQIGLTETTLPLILNFHGFYEYAAKNRFQGGSFGVTIGKKF